jgi:flagellar basal-body rod protein FlgF
MPLIEKPWIDMAQGTIQTTGNSLDLALSGTGFFAVRGSSGELYTRNGNFSLGSTGTLQTADGYPVLDTTGNPISLDASQQISVATDGTISQGGAAVAQLRVVDFAGGLSKQGSSYFRAAGSSTATTAQATVQQSKLETSNTGSAESAVRLVSVMRQFEMLQKAVSLGMEMNKSAIEQVARVGS